MIVFNDTGIVLYRYLRALSVKVSRGTVHRLLDTPAGNSLRGISDALDALRIKNEVYQLPPSEDYFAQVDAPFITMLQVSKAPFCVVTKKDDSIVEFYNSEGKKYRIGADVFLKKWTGTVLLSEVTEKPPSDPLYFWKNIAYTLSKHKAFIAVFLMLCLGILTVLRQEHPHTLTAYAGISAFGVLLSVAILYKEQFNEHFLEKFCHIGKAVDCNKVLHSKGASFAGMSLGELSLLYFATLFLFGLLCPNEFYGVAALCSIAALCVTVYSVGYQIFIIRKACMLCMLVNVTIWASAALLYGSRYLFAFHISPYALCSCAAIGCICLMAGVSIKNLCKDRQEKYALRQRMAYLLTPEAFQRLLPLEAQIESPIAETAALLNQSGDGERVMIVTNPNCGNCAKVHRQIKELSSAIPLSMVLLTFPNDKSGEYVAQTVIAAYRAEGWHKAMSMLNEWYNNRTISEAEKYPIDPEAEQMWREQQEYCRAQGISKTPVAIAGRHYIPEVYSLPELRYVLT